MFRGDEIHGVLHTSADPSAGVEIPIYNAGSNAAKVLAADERISITDIQVVSADGGDIGVHLGTSGTLGTGQTVLRGTVAANGGIAMQFQGTPRTGGMGHKPYLVGSNGGTDVMDVSFTGFITKK